MKLNEIITDIGNKQDKLLKEEIKILKEEIKNKILEYFGENSHRIQKLLETAENMPLILAKVATRGFKSLSDEEISEYNKTLNDLIMAAKEGDVNSFDTLQVTFMNAVNKLSKYVERKFNNQVNAGEIDDLDLYEKAVRKAIETYDEEKSGGGKTAKRHIEDYIFNFMRNKANKIMNERGFSMSPESVEREEGVVRGGFDKAAIEKWKEEEKEKWKEKEKTKVTPQKEKPITGTNMYDIM